MDGWQKIGFRAFSFRLGPCTSFAARITVLVLGLRINEAFESSTLTWKTTMITKDFFPLAFYA